MIAGWGDLRQRAGEVLPRLMEYLGRYWIIPLGLAVLALMGFQPQLARQVATVFLFWHYIIAIGIPVLVLCAIRWPRARLTCGVLAAIAVLTFTWPWLEDLNANGAQPKTTVLKVVTYNWRIDNKDRDTFHAWLLTEKPDLIAIEEFKKRGVSDWLYPMFPYRTKLSGGSDVILLSRYPLRGQGFAKIYGRVIIRTILTTPEGDSIVYAIHPMTLRSDSELTQRNAYLASVAQAQFTHDKRVIVLGDFNTTRWDPYFRQLRKAGGMHEQPWLFPPVTRILQANKILPFGSPIDHILVHGGHLSGCHTGPAMGSDHVPMICHVRLRP